MIIHIFIGICEYSLWFQYCSLLL